VVPGYGSAIRGRLTRTVVFMARCRFFVEAIERGHAQITGPDAHHLTRVLRVGPVQKFEISGYHRQGMSAGSSIALPFCWEERRCELNRPAASIWPILRRSGA